MKEVRLLPGQEEDAHIYAHTLIGSDKTLPFETAVLIGKGPFGRGKVWSLLQEKGVTCHNIGDIPDPDVLVVGKGDFDESAVRDLLVTRQGERLRVLSQEMVLGWILTGVDPTTETHRLPWFIAPHPGLQFVKHVLDGQWPEDTVPRVGSGTYTPGDQDEGALRRIGYRVGVTGEPEPVRHGLLREAMETPVEDFPGYYVPGYFDDWGNPNSGARLAKIANSIASFCTTAQQRADPPRQAIYDWQADLRWLRSEYSRMINYGFDWPQIE